MLLLADRGFYGVGPVARRRGHRRGPAVADPQRPRPARWSSSCRTAPTSPRSSTSATSTTPRVATGSGRSSTPSPATTTSTGSSPRSSTRRQDRPPSCRPLRPAVGVRVHSGRDQDPPRRVASRPAFTTPRRRRAGTLRLPARPPRDPHPDAPSRPRRRPRPRPDLVHPLAARRASPGHRPGGIFPPADSPAPSRPPWLRSSNACCHDAAAEPTRASSNARCPNWPLKRAHHRHLTRPAEPTVTITHASRPTPRTRPKRP